MIKALIVMLHANQYSRFFRSLARVADLQNCQIKLMANPKLQNPTAATPIVSQVAAIWNENEDDDDELAEREIIVLLTQQLYEEGCQTINFKDDTNLQGIVDSDFYSRTMLTQFFWMNAHDDHAKVAKLLYEDFPIEFVWIGQSRIWKPTTIVPSLDDLIRFVFPSFEIYAENPLSITESAILMPKNQAVDEINEAMISKFPREQATHLSFDEIDDPMEQETYMDFLNSITHTGMPPHHLVFKKNCPILLLRNINPSKGLCNGKRLICREFQKHIISAEIAVEEKKDTRRMPPNILTLDKVGPLSKNFTVHVMVTEKGLAKLMSSSSSSHQRLLLQDAHVMVQSIIYGDNIEILANKLKLYHTYAITNAVVTKIREQFRFLNKMHQLVINAKSSIEEIKIDGFSLRSLHFNFTPLSDVNVVERTDAKIGGSLAIRSPFAFIFNPSFSEALALCKWCIANAEKINNLSAANLQRAAQKKPIVDDIITIVDLPTSITRDGRAQGHVPPVNF
ncbi:hypothetical protein RHGRI_029716 [Rhododendron griersonianum]|uniref:DNA helicase Pif1-like 2B domain-containing protein n=1 Tax=Rhododendron griersonianum TaxID=479676 RepID=A0AAV6IMN1_9ERIC|nr:hypothetical protein RHGRI_029716 [Rhododendron griersonianum]